MTTDPVLGHLRAATVALVHLSRSLDDSEMAVIIEWLSDLQRIEKAIVKHGFMLKSPNDTES